MPGRIFHSDADRERFLAQLCDNLQHGRAAGRAKAVASWRVG